jgi:hypothetical protein
MMEYARPPEPGSVLIHNESEEWKAVQPMIDAGNVAADGLAIKLMVAMGAGLPEHYLSEGGDVNRATAAEMGLPVLKKYQRRQDVLRFILSSLIDRVIDEAQKAGTLPRTIDTGYAIVFPDLKAEATKDIGTAAWHMSSALQTGMQLGLVSRETASAIFFQSCRMEVDHNEEWDRIDGDKREMATAGGSAASGHPLGTHPMNQAAAGATPPANRSQTSPGNDDNPARTNGSAKPTPLTRSAS